MTEDVEIIFEDEEFDKNLNSRFLDFLNSKILINEKEEKIIDVIKNSLDPYFQIENNVGENLVNKYGLTVLMKEGVSLKNKMIKDGFNENDWDKFIKANSNFQDNKVKEIIKELDKFCNVDSWDRYFLEIPQGIITKDGLRTEVFFERVDRYTKLIIHKTNYRVESFEIKFRMRKECLDNI